RLELVEESEVDVDVVVHRAVERPDFLGSGAATRLDDAVEEHRLCGLRGAERLLPVRLDAVDDADDAAVLALVSVLPRPTFGLQFARCSARTDRLVFELPEVAEPTAAAEEEDGEQNHEPDQPAAATEGNGQAPGHPAAETSLVFDLRGIELGVSPESHLRRLLPVEGGVYASGLTDSSAGSS